MFFIIVLALEKAELKDLHCSFYEKQNYKSTSSALLYPLGSIACIAMARSNLSFKLLSFKPFWENLGVFFFLILFLPLTLHTTLNSSSPCSEITT